MLLLFALFHCVLFVDGALLSLRVQNTDSLRSIVGQVSDPNHSNYLRFLTDDELHDRFAPSPQHIDEVARWLNQSYSLVAGRRWQLDVDTDAVPLPFHPLVRGFDTSITPLVKGDSLQSMSYAIVVPQTLMTVYNSPNPITYTAKNTIRYAIVSEQITDSFLASDLSLFVALSGAPNVNITAFNASGSMGPAGVESSLDLDTLMSMAPAGSSIQYIMNSNSNPFQWCTTILNTPDSSTWPHMVSFSWGQQEAVGVQSELDGNDCLALLAAAGVAVIASSGDDGVYGASNSECATSLGFVPSLPASSPYVTAVGATMFPGTGSQRFDGVPLCNSSMTVSQLAHEFGFQTGVFNQDYPFTCFVDKSSAEVAVSKTSCSFTSGGGFSSLFPQPSYQQAAVAAYLSSSVPLPVRSAWNANNRAFPDVSMYGCGSPVVVGGALEYEGGTSQSAPLFAGVMGFVIDWYITLHGKGPGFLNPLLYQLYARNPSVFNDVVSGNNNGTSVQFPSQCPLGGFTAAPGWDPVTGLGTPNVRLMISELGKMFAEGSSTGPAPYVIVTTSAPSSSQSSVPSWVYGVIGGGIGVTFLLLCLYANKHND